MLCTIFHLLLLPKPILQYVTQILRDSVSAGIFMMSILVILEDDVNNPIKCHVENHMLDLDTL